MGKTYTTRQDRFDGGMLTDLRSDSEVNPRGFALTKHFNIRLGKTLEPYRNMEADEVASYEIVKFAYAPKGSDAYTLYGLGVEPGEDHPEIYYKADETDPIGDTWTGVNANNKGDDTRAENAFIHFKNNLYGFQAGTHIWKFGDLTGTPTFTKDHVALAYTHVAQPVHHPADDTVYLFVDNKVYSFDGTTATLALTLPTNLRIIDGEPFKDYLAIACKPTVAGTTTPYYNLTAHSIVFLWDRDSSLSTVSQKIDFGEGDIRFIANLGGNLVGVSEFFSATGYYGAGFEEIQIRIAIGNKAEIVRRIPCTGGTNAIANKVVTNERLYFPVGYTLRGVTHRDIMSVDAQGNPTFEITTPATAAIEGIFKVGGYWFVAHGGAGEVDRTDTGSTYTDTSIFESKIFQGVSSRLKKKLIGITVTTEPLPSGGQVVLKYKKDFDISETTWTTIFTNTTVTAGSFVTGTKYTIISVGTTDFTLIGASSNATGVEFTATGAGTGTGVVATSPVSHSAVTSLPEYKEIQFRIESTGGAKITGLEFKYEVIGKDIYE